MISEERGGELTEVLNQEFADKGAEAAEGVAAFHEKRASDFRKLA